ncbi:hypothetical protein MATL_G00186350 [Megalops atlanticus]|uniref:Uncharacterized protein n=1 Tax=Megalops atlanticus TaxID=7932 RepID=A0A9D3SZR1_MEGAT|nr:hypothetical protein MATL_G00186350 [Megalops atlanticus]
MELFTKTAVAEIKKLFDDCPSSPATLCFEMSWSSNENEAQKKLTESECRTKQLVSIMETLTKEALEKISRLVDQKSASSRLELAQNENEALKRKVLLMESELKMVQGHGDGRALESSANKPRRSVGVQVGGEFTRTASEEEHPTTAGLCSDAELTDVVEEDMVLQSAVTSDKCADMEEEMLESLTEEARTEDILSSVPQERMKISAESKCSCFHHCG